MQDIIIFTVGIISGIIGTTIGGSMLIIIPFLVSLGLNPLQAIATANFSLIGGFFSGGLKYFKIYKKKDKKNILKLSILSILGTIIGILLLIYLNDNIDTKIINIIIITFLISILFITIFKNKFFIVKEKRAESKNSKGFIIFILLSIYGGLLGAGNGIFLIFVLVNILGFSYLKSTGIMTIISFFTTIISTVIFYYKGVINFEIGIIFLMGIIIGGYIGAFIAIKKGDKLLKVLFITLTIIMIIKMIYSTFLI